MRGIYNVYLEIRGYLGHSDIRKHCPFRDFIVWIGFCVMLTLIDRVLGDREIAVVLVGLTLSFPKKLCTFKNTVNCGRKQVKILNLTRPR